MGTKATQIVGLDINEVIEDLRRAYADEWLAAQGYLYMAQVVTGRPAAERGAIEVYDALARKCHGKDVLTYELAVHILGEEVEHEDKFEGLIK